MHSDSADRSAMAFANFNFRGFNFRTIFIFREIRKNYTPAKKMALQYLISRHLEMFEENILYIVYSSFNG